MFDVVISGGTFTDGRGSPAQRGDLGIAAGRIAALGDLARAETAHRLDATGRVVCPGFIDLHTHCGFATEHDGQGLNLNYLQQGVTTVVGGNCGFSPTDFGPLAAGFPKDTSGVNLAMMVGHNSVRLAVMGLSDRAPSDTELATMKRLVAAAMERGAIAFSSGLYYVPGAYAHTGEVVELAKTAAAHGGFYATHMRSEGDAIEAAMTEAFTVGRESGLPVQISHHKVCGLPNWGKSERLLAMLEEARADGLDVTPDQYPYTASCSRIGSLLPRWACAGSDAEARARFDDPAARTRIAADVVARLKRFYGGELDRIRIASSTVRPDLAGATFAQIAAQRGAADPYADIVDFVLEMARSHPASSDTMCIFHTMCEADVLRIMAYPHTCIASDGWGVKMGAGHPHPRLYGTFPRVLGRYCRDQRLFPFAEAVRRMTSLPAARLGIADRGVLCKGAWADLTVLGPATVADTASFEAPHHYPVGIDYVIVNGQVVLDHGRHTGALPGVFIPRAR